MHEFWCNSIGSYEFRHANTTIYQNVPTLVPKKLSTSFLKLSPRQLPIYFVLLFLVT